MKAEPCGEGSDCAERWGHATLDIFRSILQGGSLIALTLTWDFDTMSAVKQPCSPNWSMPEPGYILQMQKGPFSCQLIDFIGKQTNKPKPFCKAYSVFLFLTFVLRSICAMVTLQFMLSWDAHQQQDIFGFLWSLDSCFKHSWMIQLLLAHLLKKSIVDAPLFAVWMVILSPIMCRIHRFFKDARSVAVCFCILQLKYVHTSVWQNTFFTKISRNLD